MTIAMKRTGLIAALGALIATAACSNKTQPVDNGLKADLAAVSGKSANSDLELAPSSAKSQMVVSAIEGGQKAASAPAAPKRAPRPAPKAVTHVAAQETPAPAPAPRPVETAPVEQAPVIQAPAPRPAPQQAPREDHRIYKTEGEIFRQMPWIKP